MSVNQLVPKLESVDQLIGERLRELRLLRSLRRIIRRKMQDDETAVRQQASRIAGDER